jgi:hypothetical protein
MLDLESRRLSPITSPTVKEFENVERDQDNPRWVIDRTGAPVVVADELSSGLQPFVAPPALPSEGVVSSAIMLTQHCLSDIEPGRPSRSPARVRVEILRALRAVQEIDPSRASELLSTVRDFTFPLAMQAMTSDDGPMVSLDIGLQMLMEERFADYNWAEEAYKIH